VTGKQRIVGLFLDERSVVRRSPQIEHDRKVAVYDILEENIFSPAAGHPGPFNLHLSIEENRLIFSICDEGDTSQERFSLPLSSFRSIIRDYFLVCQSYEEAIKFSSPSKIEAIDMGRRGLHDEGARLLRERLADKVEMDDGTARRLFTLICVLHVH